MKITDIIPHLEDLEEILDTFLKEVIVPMTTDKGPSKKDIFEFLTHDGTVISGIVEKIKKTPALYGFLEKDTETFFNRLSQNEELKTMIEKSVELANIKFKNTPDASETELKMLTDTDLIKLQVFAESGWIVLARFLASKDVDTKNKYEILKNITAILKTVMLFEKIQKMYAHAMEKYLVNEKP
jgi:hypothetical protein